MSSRPALNSHYLLHTCLTTEAPAATAPENIHSASSAKDKVVTKAWCADGTRVSPGRCAEQIPGLEARDTGPRMPHVSQVLAVGQLLSVFSGRREREWLLLALGVFIWERERSPSSGELWLY